MSFACGMRTSRSKILGVKLLFYRLLLNQVILDRSSGIIIWLLHVCKEDTVRSLLWSFMTFVYQEVFLVNISCFDRVYFRPFWSIFRCHPRVRFQKGIVIYIYFIDFWLLISIWILFRRISFPKSSLRPLFLKILDILQSWYHHISIVIISSPYIHDQTLRLRIDINSTPQNSSQGFTTLLHLRTWPLYLF